MSSERKVPLSQVWVNGVPYQVVEEDKPRNEEGRILYGETRYGKLQLAIDPGNPLHRVRETVLHETMHAVDDEYGLGLEEAIVDRLSRALYATLRANPDLVKFILGD
jgi:hypothetical protein